MIVLAAVAAGIVLSGITTTGRRVWKWMSTLPAKLKNRRLTAQRAKEQKVLIAARQDVRRRSEAVGIDLPWSRDHTWPGPGVRLIWRSGTDTFYINAWEHGIGQYEAAMQAGTVPPGRTSPESAPRVVEQWNLEELENWLVDHPPA